MSPFCEVTEGGGALLEDSLNNFTFYVQTKVPESGARVETLQCNNSTGSDGLGATSGAANHNQQI